MVDDRGALYVATGAKYVNEAERSARSFKQMMPDLSCAIMVDDAALISENTSFDKIIVLGREPEYSFFDRIPALKDSPYERTLYLDTDTVCVDTCWELFDLLERFEVAAAHAPWRFAYASFTDFKEWYDTEVCPIAFPEFNCGVILFRGSPKFAQFIDHWEERYLAHREASGLGRRTTDQPSFRESLYRSSLDMVVLPPEYNVRTPFPYFVGGNAKAKILHGRDPSLSEVRRHINTEWRPRTGGVPSNYWIRIGMERRARRLRSKLGLGSRAITQPK